MSVQRAHVRHVLPVVPNVDQRLLRLVPCNVPRRNHGVALIVERTAVPDIEIKRDGRIDRENVIIVADLSASKGTAHEKSADREHPDPQETHRIDLPGSTYNLLPLQLLFPLGIYCQPNMR